MCYAVLPVAVLVGLFQHGCTSQERPTDAGPSGIGGTGSTAIVDGAGGVSGTGGVDLHCLDGSDGCVWSCGVGSESGTGNGPYPNCVDGQLTCPTGSQKVSACAPESCARRHGYCCDIATGKVSPPACGADGVRETVCPDGSDALSRARCIPAGLAVSSCLGLDSQACTTLSQECHFGVVCRCIVAPDSGLIWQCSGIIP
jgi:hypothetical protein